MPMGSTPKEFADAVAERRSRITKALDQLFDSPGTLPTDPILGPHVAALNAPGFFGSNIPKWIRDALKARGVKKQREFNHINNWPKSQMEAVRDAMEHAIKHDVKMRFFWELFAGPAEETAFEPYPLPDEGLITVTFRSPQRRVHYKHGEVMTDVG